MSRLVADVDHFVDDAPQPVAARGKRQVNYGVLADALGRPAALRVFPGNTSDSAAVRKVLLDLRARFATTSASAASTTTPHRAVSPRR